MRTILCVVMMLLMSWTISAQMTDEIIMRSMRQSHILQKKLNLTEDQRCQAEMIISDVMFKKFEETNFTGDVEELFHFLRIESFAKIKEVFPSEMHARIDSVESQISVQMHKRAERIKRKIEQKNLKKQ